MRIGMAAREPGEREPKRDEVPGKGWGRGRKERNGGEREEALARVKVFKSRKPC